MADILPEIGVAAPDFSHPTQTGDVVSLSDFKGKKSVVLFFYPKADTPGCTAEACGFRDNLPHFEEMDAVVLGISADPVKKQAKFADKYTLPFPLLADDQHVTAEAYGVWKEKKFMGKNYMGIERSTFVIDREGVLRNIFQKIDIPNHASQVAEAVKALG